MIGAGCPVPPGNRCLSLVKLLFVNRFVPSPFAARFFISVVIVIAASVIVVRGAARNRAANSAGRPTVATNKAPKAVSIIGIVSATTGGGADRLA
jgi:hypothetical protein